MRCRWNPLSGLALAGLLLQSLLISPFVSAQVSVWTHHNDNARTGANLQETQLNTINVNASQFGKLFGYSVDGAIFAQPLVIPNVNTASKGLRNVVFVATMNNSVYAFDADDAATDAGQPIWSVNFNNPAAGVTPVPGEDISFNRSYTGPYGIMGTPVIDEQSRTLYLVARTKENGSYVQRLHALDITSGQQRTGSPVTITATFTNADQSTVVFNPKTQNQRPALLLANGRVYVAWASVEDITPYQGWLIAYDAVTLERLAVFNTAPKGSMAGIWMSGEAPSVDAAGNLYLTTGNGSWNGTTNFAQSVLKLSPSLALLDWFTPHDWSATNDADLDIGSTGAILLPQTNYLVTGTKDGTLYLLDTGNLGHLAANNTQIPQHFRASSGRHIHGSPVFWNRSAGRLAYLMAEQDRLKAFRFTGTAFDTTPVTQSTFTAAPPAPAAPGGPGGFLSLSANGDSAGIVWVSMPLALDAESKSVPGVLRAFDATNLGTQLWNSQTNCADQVGSYAKYVPPTVANGKVYLATFSNQLLVYGLLGSVRPPIGGVTSTVACSGAGVNLTSIGTADWAKWPDYIHKATGGSQISDALALGAGTPTESGNSRGMSWSDGTPVASATSNHDVLSVSGNGTGFRLTAPADTQSRTLHLYPGGFNSSGTVVVRISDGSAPDYVNSLSGTGEYQAVYSLTYRAASSGQQLEVNWIQTSDEGNVTLQAAALTPAIPAPLPPSGVTASNGTSTDTITVTWAASANATSYTVYRSTRSGIQGTPISGVSSTSFMDESVVPGTAYYYSIVATGVSGDSAPSLQAGGHAGPSPAATAFANLAGATGDAISAAAGAAGVAATPGSPQTVAAAGAAQGGALSGTSLAESSTVNLTAVGSSDWAKWPGYLHKATGGNQISTYVTVGAVAVRSYSGDPRTLAWTDGAPLPSGSDQAGLHVSGIGTGFQLTAPADTASRTLYLYVGGLNSSATLSAQLSDGSAPDYTVRESRQSAQYNRVYALTYRAASPGQHLSVRWTQTSTTGNVRLQAAALQ